MKRLAILITGAVLALSAASNALAASSTCSAYSPQTCSTVTTTTTPTPSIGGSTTTTAVTSTLPFTGMDVALLLVGGAGLLGAGLVVRRISRRSN